MGRNRRIYMKYVETGVRGVIELYDDLAPETCDAIFGALSAPVSVQAVHAMFAGPEIMTGLPEEAQLFDPALLPPENQTCFPGAGECLWYYQAKGSMAGLPGELWEVGLFYAPGGRIFGPLGWTPCTIFGRMVENLDAFAAACADLRISGAKTLEMGRVQAD